MIVQCNRSDYTNSVKLLWVWEGLFKERDWLSKGKLKIRERSQYINYFLKISKSQERSASGELTSNPANNNYYVFKLLFYRFKFVYYIYVNLIILGVYLLYCLVTYNILKASLGRGICQLGLWCPNQLTRLNIVANVMWIWSVKIKHSCMKDNILVSKSIVWNAVNETSSFPWGGLNWGGGGYSIQRFVHTPSTPNG